MLRNEAIHFTANLIKKTLQDKYLLDFLCLSQGFLVSGLGVSGFGKCIKRNKSRHHDASYFLLTLLYY